MYSLWQFFPKVNISITNYWIHVLQFYGVLHFFSNQFGLLTFYRALVLQFLQTPIYSLQNNPYPSMNAFIIHELYKQKNNLIKSNMYMLLNQPVNKVLCIETCGYQHNSDLLQSARSIENHRAFSICMNNEKIITYFIIFGNCIL